MAIVGFYTDGTGTNGDGDAFSWIALNNIAAGEVIYFTDSGYTLSSSSFQAENLLRFDVPAGGISAGSVSSLEIGTLPAGYSVQTIAAYASGLDINGNVSLNFFSGSGDQLVAFQDPNVSDINGFLGLSALSNASTSFGRQGSTSSTTTDLYPGMTNNGNAIAVGAGSGSSDEFDNVRYTGPVGLSAVQQFAAINTPSNWERTNSPQADYLTWTAGSLAIPEPSTAILSALSSLFLLHRKRH